MSVSPRPPVPVLDLKAQQARSAADLRRRLDAVLAHCQFVMGPEVAELEQELARFCGAKHCIGVSSGTDALQIALMAEEVGRGDAVCLPAFTYTATAEVPLVLGAGPDADSLVRPGGSVEVSLRLSGSVDLPVAQLIDAAR